MHSLFPFKHLRTRLAIFLLLAAVIPLAVVSVIIYYQRVQAIQAEAFVKLQAIRDLKILQLVYWLGQRETDISIIAADHEIRDVAEMLTHEERLSGDEEALENARALLQRYVKGYGVYEEIFIVGAQSGKIAVSTNQAHLGEDRSDDIRFLEPLRTKEFFIRDIYFSQTFGRPSMAFSVPIIGADETAEIVAVLIARVGLENSLYDLLLNRTGMGKTGETLIVNQEVVALNELRWYERAPLELEIESEPAVLAAQGQTGITETADYRGELVLAAYAHIDKMNWGFVAKQDLAEVYAPIRLMVINLAVLFVIAACAATVFSFLLAGTIVRPVVEMSEVSRKLQSGDLSARNRIVLADELGFLAQSFNEMADSLVSQMTVLRDSAGIIDSMTASIEAPAAAQSLVEKLLEITKSDMGVFYLREEAGQTFAHVAAVGANRELLAPFDGATLEGSLGKALSSKKIVHDTELPEDTRFLFRTAAGVALPREALTAPLLVRGQVQAVVALASAKPYAKEALKAIEHAWPAMNTALANLLGAKESRALADELADRNRELLQQAGELKDQAAILEEQRSAVQEADQLKSEFLSNMSHELRTPLNSILTLSELMASRGPGANVAKDAEYLRIIQQNGYHLLNLINDILDLSKIEAGQLELSLSDFNPRYTLEQAVDATQPLAAEKNLELRIQVAETPMMCSDEEKVHQIILNLVSNAVKFTETGHIDVAVSSTEGEVIFKVQDTGIGIAEDDLPHIFDEFRQVDGSTSRLQEGTGLGLAICQQLARLLGGRITVRSELGKGSSFALTLPAQCPAPTPAASAFPRAAPAPPEQVAQQLERPQHETETEEETAAAQEVALEAEPVYSEKTVLIIEDNPDNMYAITELLDCLGCKYLKAEDGKQGVILAEQNKPDLIIMDIQLPGLSGLGATRQVRKMAELSGTPIIAMTAKAMKGDREMILASGCDAYLPKPLNTKEALELIKKWLDWKQGFQQE